MGIIATFFAPTWTQRRMERRKEKREFRRAARLVADEIKTAADSFVFIVGLGRVPDRALIESGAFVRLDSWAS